MLIQIKLDPTWRERKGERPYKFARIAPEGSARPVRYAGLSRVVGEVLNLNRADGFVEVMTNESIASFKKEN